MSIKAEVFEEYKEDYCQYWGYVNEKIDKDGWVYSKEVPHLLDAYYEQNTGREIEFQKTYEGEWRGYRWRPKSITNRK